METVQTIPAAGGPEPVKAIPQRDRERFEALLLRYSPVLFR